MIAVLGVTVAATATVTTAVAGALGVQYCCYYCLLLLTACDATTRGYGCHGFHRVYADTYTWTLTCSRLLYTSHAVRRLFTVVAVAGK
jgi:hypothetical protein